MSLQRLRPYQGEVVRAVLRSAYAGDGLTFSVMIARQGGKNELSAQLELARLVADAQRGGESIKCAPTFDPQCRISMRRLWGCVQAVGFDSPLTPTGGGAARGGLTGADGWNGIRVGRAVQRFLSCEPGASVVGHTASRLLEADEAQDIDQEKFDRDFRPMASTTNATTVYYGTAWDEGCLLAQMRDRHLELERRDGVRRHFEYGWEVVAAHNPAYGTFVEGERERLGAEHPLFQTQYLLRTLPGAGRLLSTAAVDLLDGAFGRLSGPEAGGLYVGGLDVGGQAGPLSQDPVTPNAGGMNGGRDADASVLCIGRVRRPELVGSAEEPSIEVVALYAWRGVGQSELVAAVLGLARDRWRLRSLVVDATGVGEGIGSALSSVAGWGSGVRALRLSEPVKSSLGYGLQAAAGCGRVRVYGGVDTERDALLQQCRLARARYRPNRSMDWRVDERDGHDDHVMALALCVEAAGGVAPAVAVGRRSETDE